MKMVMAVISKEEAAEVINELVAAGHTATFIDSRGGVLRQAYQTLFVAVKDESLDEVLGTIGRSCHSCVALETTESDAQGQVASARDIAQVGGAVVFYWELQGFLKF